MNDTTTTTKLLIALSIFTISFLSSAAPLKVINIDDQVFSCGNLLASGVLLSASLVHQLPESIVNLQNHTDYPLATFTMGLTFCFFLILEEYLHTRFENNPFEDEEEDHDDHEQQNNNKELFALDEEKEKDKNESDRLEREIQRLLMEQKKIKDQREKKRFGDITASRTRGTKSDRPYDISKCSYRRPSSITYVEAPRWGRQQPDGDGGNVAASESSILLGSKTFRPNSFPGFSFANAGMVSIRKSNRPSSMFNSMLNQNFDTQHPVHHHDDHLAEHMHGSLLASIILLCALSIHSIFEGLAIGVASDMTEVVSTAAAVLAHKAFAGYALGSSMVASQMKSSHVLVLCFVFGLCSIIGVFLGMIVMEFSGRGNKILSGIIQAAVAGTFLYVSIVEIGMKELMMHRDNHSSKNHLSRKTMEFGKLLAFLVGYLAMSALAIWV